MTDKELKAIEWLLDQMQPSYMSHGTGWWSLPLGTLSGIVARTPLEAVLRAHERYESQVAKPVKEAVK